MFSVYGPNQNLTNKMQGMVSIYLSFMLEGSPIIVKGSADRFRDFIYIDDVVDAWLSAWENDAASGQTYNLGSGTATTVATLLQLMRQCFGQESYPISYASNTPGDQHGMVAETSKMRNHLGWAPRQALRAGLEQMIRSYGRRS
jgi:UDP-glucose 4-epimerase